MIDKPLLIRLAAVLAFAAFAPALITTPAYQAWRYSSDDDPIRSWARMPDSVTVYYVDMRTHRVTRTP